MISRLYSFQIIKDETRKKNNPGEGKEKGQKQRKTSENTKCNKKSKYKNNIVHTICPS